MPFQYYNLTYKSIITFANYKIQFFKFDIREIPKIQNQTKNRVPEFGSTIAIQGIFIKNFYFFQIISVLGRYGVSYTKQRIENFIIPRKKIKLTVSLILGKLTAAVSLLCSKLTEVSLLNLKKFINRTNFSKNKLNY